MPPFAFWATLQLLNEESTGANAERFALAAVVSALTSPEEARRQATLEAVSRSDHGEAKSLITRALLSRVPRLSPAARGRAVAALAALGESAVAALSDALTAPTWAFARGSAESATRSSAPGFARWGCRRATCCTSAPWSRARTS